LTPPELTVRELNHFLIASIIWSLAFLVDDDTWENFVKLNLIVWRGNRFYRILRYFWEIFFSQRVDMSVFDFLTTSQNLTTQNTRLKPKFLDYLKLGVALSKVE
jgi:hypothetical protein